MYFDRTQSKLHLLQVPAVCSPLILLAFYPEIGDWTVFFGRFHPVVLHLPIGILLLTTLMEVLRFTGSQFRPMEILNAVTSVSGCYQCRRRNGPGYPVDEWRKNGRCSHRKPFQLGYSHCRRSRSGTHHPLHPALFRFQNTAYPISGYINSDLRHPDLGQPSRCVHHPW